MRFVLGRVFGILQVYSSLRVVRPAVSFEPTTIGVIVWVPRYSTIGFRRHRSPQPRPSRGECVTLGIGFPIKPAGLTRPIPHFGPPFLCPLSYDA